jgi:hypothetical protein
MVVGYLDIAIAWIIGFRVQGSGFDWCRRNVMEGHGGIESVEQKFDSISTWLVEAQRYDAAKYLKQQDAHACEVKKFAGRRPDRGSVVPFEFGT